MEKPDSNFREPKRAKRIRKRLDKVRRARNKFLETYWYFHLSKSQHRLEQAEMFARYHADNMKSCSCDACCNPRRSGYSSGKYKHTMQEIRHGAYKKHKKLIDSEE